MLSPNSIPSKKTGRNLSTWSIDSGYGPGIHEDAKLGSILDARDVTPRGSVAMSQPQSRSVGLGISRLPNLNTGDHILIKKEDCTFTPSTPRLRVCTTVSNPSSPDPVSPASPSEVRRSHARKSASKLPSQAVRRLTAWLDTNRHHPYPSAETKQALAEACSITIKQVTTWFTNIRQRQLKTQEDDTERLGNNHAQISHQGSRKGKKKDYSRSNGASPIEGFLSPPRLSPSASISEHSSGEGEGWQCTFCGVSLTAKSWRRHEETQHHPKHQWTCLAHGPMIQLSTSSESICAFCELKNPNEDHFRLFHRIGDCLCKPEQERTFGRPDHLQQHARNFHKCDQPLSELVRDTWRRDGPGMIDNKSWTCGFCHEELRTWDARATHIANHFKSGLTMAQWRADRVLQSSLPEDDFQFSAPTALNALASMEVTLAGPSNLMSGPPNYGRPHPMQQMQAQPIPASTMMPVATTVPDFDFDPFGAYYGNPIDTFDPSLPTSASYYPVVSNVPAAAQNGVVSPMDYGVIAFDEFGAPVYDMSGMHSW